VKRDALPDLHTENNAAWHADHAQRKEAHEQRLQARSEELADAIHFSDGLKPLSRIPLPCGCVWECNGWERGRADSYGSFRWVAIEPRFSRECSDHE
jgi:hypothetical protein